MTDTRDKLAAALNAADPEPYAAGASEDEAYYTTFADALLASDVLRDMLAEAEARGRASVGFNAAHPDFQRFLHRVTKRAHDDGAAEVAAAVEAEIEPQWRSILDSLEDYDSTSDAWIAGRNWMIDRLRDALADRGALDRVRAEALREAADDLARIRSDGPQSADDEAAEVPHWWLRDRADRLERDGGA